MKRTRMSEQEIGELAALSHELELKNRFLLSENRRLREQVGKLYDELRYLRRTLFGRSSERVVQSDSNQLKFDFYMELHDGDILSSSKITTTDITNATESPRPPKRPVRKPLPDHLERREEIIEPSPLPKDAKCIGQEVTEVLEYIPGQLYVRRIIRKNMH